MKNRSLPLRLLTILVLALIAAPSSFAFDTQDLMHELAQVKRGQARFSETKYLAVLDRPVKSSGKLSFEAPAMMEKITLEPKHESMLLEGNTLTVVRSGKKMVVQLDSHPQVLAFVEAIRGLLMGDQQLLEKGYNIQLSGNKEHWDLALTPKEGQLAEVIKQIKVKGTSAQLRSIEYLQRDSDRSVMVIEPLLASDAPVKAGTEQ